MWGAGRPIFSTHKSGLRLRPQPFLPKKRPKMVAKKGDQEAQRVCESTARHMVRTSGSLSRHIKVEGDGTARVSRIGNYAKNRSNFKKYIPTQRARMRRFNIFRVSTNEPYLTTDSTLKSRLRAVWLAP